ncbi:hypothetical protein M408DRAFT_187574 [Serendipita vermifera MAFF 305830]|uniref:Uncharacterized protein n=1 Tax=Serendipita vermifera MAFF 305830 TaxID=933852 RepID=A0A0C3BN25_SERVB|nr:hypothetical protein M408DRAFT_187574 [Serendipita vermifera MAFF 305830]
MPHDRRRSTLSEVSWTPRAEMFNLEALNTPEGLEAASSYLQSACYSSKNPSLLLKTAATYLLTLDSCCSPRRR